LQAVPFPSEIDPHSNTCKKALYSIEKKSYALEQIGWNTN